MNIIKEFEKHLNGDWNPEIYYAKGYHYYSEMRYVHLGKVQIKLKPKPSSSTVKDSFMVLSKDNKFISWRNHKEDE